MVTRSPMYTGLRFHVAIAVASARVTFSGFSAPASGRVPVQAPADYTVTPAHFQSPFVSEQTALASLRATVSACRGDNGALTGQSQTGAVGVASGLRETPSCLASLGHVGRDKGREEPR